MDLQFWIAPVSMTPSQKPFFCVRMILMSCVCVPMCGHLWDSEDNLRCQSSPSITLETAPLLLLAAVHAWLAGPRASGDLLPHCRTGGVADIHCFIQFLYMGSGDLNSCLYACTASSLPTEPSLWSAKASLSGLAFFPTSPMMPSNYLYILKISHPVNLICR